MALLNASTPVLATIDDHEIVDNFAGGAAPGQSPDASDVDPLEPPLFTDAVGFVNETQELLVTVYGVDAYNETDLLTDPNSVINQVPRIVSQFIVYPSKVVTSIRKNPFISLLAEAEGCSYTASGVVVRAMDTLPEHIALHKELINAPGRS